MPDLERRGSRHVLEVPISGEEGKAMPNAELRYQRVNSSNLYSGAATCIAQGGGVDVIVPIRNQEWHR
jgi:hypothetical protein